MNMNFSKVVTGVNADFNRPAVVVRGHRTVKVIYKSRHGATRYGSAVSPKYSH